jgi:hypothetical protein
MMDGMVEVPAVNNSEDAVKDDIVELNGGVRHLQEELEAEMITGTEVTVGAETGVGALNGVGIQGSTIPRVCLSDHSAFLSHMMTCGLKIGQEGKDFLVNIPQPFANKLPGGFQMSSMEVKC